MTKTERKGINVLVTGGGSGIGRAVALGMAAGGCRVVIAGRRMEALLDVAKADSSGDISAIAADVANADQVDDLVRESVRRLGHLDGVVNAAGVHMVAPSEALSDADFQRIIDINLTGAFRVSRSVGQHMLERQSGSIVHIASLSSYGGFPGRLAYGVAKAGVVQLVQTLASEWGPRGVRVNAVAPGFVKTRISDRLEADGLLDGSGIERRTPLRRRAKPTDMVGPIRFLLSDASAFVTGQCLVADGGWLAQVGPTDGSPDYP